MDARPALVRVADAQRGSPHRCCDCEHANGECVSFKKEKKKKKTVNVIVKLHLFILNNPLTVKFKICVSLFYFMYSWNGGSIFDISIDKKYSSGNLSLDPKLQ